MAVLLLADVNGGQLATDSVAKALTGVAGLGEVHLLVAGPASAAAEAAGLSGVAKVLHADEAGHGVNAGVKLGHVAAQNWATLGLCGTRVMCGGQSCALPI
jgi:hypothetical protein